MRIINQQPIWQSSILRVIVLLSALGIVALSASEKLIYGARWSSGLPLAGIDNFMSGGSMYPTSADSISAGSSYFPGNLFLAFVFRSLFGFGADTAFIIFGAFSWVITSLGFSILMFKSNNLRFWMFILSVFFLAIELPAARHYLLEVHPDIPSLMCFIWGIILMPIEKTNHRKLSYFWVVILFYCSGLFKQNSAFLYIGLGIYCFCSKKISWKDKRSILICELIAGILLLITVFSIDGCWLNCVTINAKHHYMHIRWIIAYLQNVIKHDWLFVLSVLYFIYLMLKRRIVLSPKVEMWLFSSVAWTAFCLFGSIKEGANDGNIEAAIISLMPFSLYAIYNLSIITVHRFKYLKQLTLVLFSNNTLLTFCVLFFLFFCHCATKITCNYELFQKRLVAQNEFSNWISKQFRGKNIAYNTCAYEFLNNADIIKKSDINTIEVWHWAGLIDDMTMKQLSQEEQWDLIMTLNGIDGHYWPQTFESYQLIDEKDYPFISHCVPSKVCLYIRKDIINQ